MLSIVYDLPTTYSPDDPIVTGVNKFVAKWKKEAEDGYNEYSKMFLGLFRDVENRIVMSFIRFSLPPGLIVGDRNKAMNDLVLLGFRFENRSAIS